MIERVFIVGTGLLGTSVGLALREAGFRGSITGWNRCRIWRLLALKLGAVDSLATDGVEAAQASEVTVVAVPIFATLDWMESWQRYSAPEQRQTDVGSTKRVISGGGSARLYNTPERAAFLPGHIRWREASAVALRWLTRIYFAVRCGCSRTVRMCSVPRGERT